MNKLIIDELYIFSLKKKKAKKVSFVEGCNIITSSKDNGNDRGKSSIMKSIYYSLGADTIFTTKWSEDNKCYLLKFYINEKQYTIYRFLDIFKIYDVDYKKIFETNDRNKLGEFFKDKFGFYTYLPKRNTKIHEVTPPVYNFLINFTDQTRMQCTDFKSFNNLTQYESGYKEKILWQYMGLYKDGYFDLRSKKDLLEKDNRGLDKKVKLNENIMAIINTSIDNQEYSISYENLLTDLERNKLEYFNITKKMISLKKKLIKIRNTKEDILFELKEIRSTRRETEKNTKKLSENEVFNEIGNLILLKNDLENAITRLDKEILKEEEKYKESINILHSYEKKIGIDNIEIENVVEYKGMISLREKILEDIAVTESEISINKKSIQEINKKLKQDKEKQDRVNSRYFELMMNDRSRLNLVTEINESEIKSIEKSYNVGGSNIPLGTIMYIINLLKLKLEFNPDGFIYPVLFDSPNNTESDLEKKDMLYEYIFKNRDKNTQYIISGIGIDRYETEDIRFNRIIELNNEKYNLLNEKDYIENIQFLEQLL